MEYLLSKIGISSFYNVLPFSTLVLTSIIILLLSTFIRSRRSYFYNIIAFLGLASSLLLLLFLPDKNVIFNHLMGVMVIDKFSRFLSIIIVIGTFITILQAIDSVELKESPFGEFYSILLLASSGMVLLVSAKDFIGILFGIEIMSLSSYVLTGFLRKSKQSSEGALKYFILGAFSTGILIYGIALIFGATGLLDLYAMSKTVSSLNNQALFFVGMIFLIAGFGFKVAAVPFHMWTPDVYEGAPTSITAYMSALVKLSAFGAFLKVLMVAGRVTGTKWFEILWIISAITMTLGNIAALRQNNIKRMLAFSSIAHAGYILIGVVGLKLANEDIALSCVIFYILSYALMTFCAFGCVIALQNKGNNISNYSGISKQHPVLSAVFAVALLSLAGVPPFVGFFSKFYIFVEAINRGLLFLVIIAILNSAVAAYYYLRVIVKMYFDDATAEESIIKCGFGTKLALTITSLGIILIGIFPEYILKLTLFDKILH